MAPGELRPRTRARHRPVQRPGSAPSFPEVLGTPRRPRPAAVAPHGGLGCEASACGVTTSRMKPHVTAGPGRRSGACLPAAAGRGPSWGPPVSARRPAPSAHAPLPGASPSVSCRSGPRKVREGAGGQARGGRGSAVLLAGLRPPGLRSSVRSEAPAQCRRRLALGGASCRWRGRTALQGVTQPQGGARPAPAVPSAPCQDEEPGQPLRFVDLHVAGHKPELDPEVCASLSEADEKLAWRGVAPGPAAGGRPPSEQESHGHRVHVRVGVPGSLCVSRK